MKSMTAQFHGLEDREIKSTIKITLFRNPMGSQDKVASCCFHPRLMKKYRCMLSATQINFIQSILFYLQGGWSFLEMECHCACLVRICKWYKCAWESALFTMKPIMSVRSESPSIGHMSYIYICIHIQWLCNRLHAEGHSVNLPDVYYSNQHKRSSGALNEGLGMTGHGRTTDPPTDQWNTDSHLAFPRTSLDTERQQWHAMTNAAKSAKLTCRWIVIAVSGLRWWWN